MCGNLEEQGTAQTPSKAASDSQPSCLISKIGLTTDIFAKSFGFFSRLVGFFRQKITPPSLQKHANTKFATPFLTALRIESVPVTAC